jgi:hypothetical protein
MKNTNFNFFKGKAAKILLTVAVLTSAGIAACKKDAANTSTGTVTEADMAQLTTDAVIPSTGGLVEQTNTSVNIYTGSKLSCGDTKDTTIAKSSTTGVTPSYSYLLAWNYTLNCNGVVPSQFNFTFTGNSSYNGVLMSANDSSTGTLALSGLQLTAADYVYNTYYERSGSETSKIAQQNTFTSKIIIQSTNIIIAKSTDEITSGTASVAITGASTSGKSFKFNGTITFLGNQQATLVLNSGKSYPIQWN